MKKQVGERIRIQRNIKGMSQEYVAQQVGLSNGAYSNIERGVTDIPINRIYQLAEFFDVSVYELIPPNKKPFQQVEDPHPRDYEKLLEEIRKLTERVDQIDSKTQTYRSLRSKKR